MDVLDAIKNRRSIRHYKNDPVDDAKVRAVLEAAHWAPSWGNFQCWRFIVVRDAKTKAEVAGCLMKEKVDNEWLESAASLSIKQAPVLIVVCAEKARAGCNAEGTPITDKGEYWFMFDIALATENLVLAAHAMGLGTVIVGGFDAVKAAKILEVPLEYAVVTMTPMGVPNHKGQVSPRKQLSEVLFNEKYGR
ncbi:MAG: nitroreductase family protein [Dehalococcoidales bacterium]|jgi:nitroreductase